MLQVEQLVTHYDSIEALHAVSLAVAAGEIVALIGANGAGKTTLLRTISGLQRATAGRVLFQGAEIQRLAPERIAALGIAHVPEGRHVFPELTVEENLLMGAFRRRDRAGIGADLAAIFERFPRLRERRRQLAGSMSGGEQQMLAIGRALMSRPQLLLLDEPSMGLAPIFVEEIFRIVAEIHRAGTAVLLVEQNATAALAIAQRAYVLESGRIVISGTAAALAADPAVREAYLGGRAAAP